MPSLPSGSKADGEEIMVSGKVLAPVLVLALLVVIFGGLYGMSLFRGNQSGIETVQAGITVTTTFE